MFLPGDEPPDVSAWQRALDAAGFAVDLGDTMTPDPEDGTLSVTWREQYVPFALRIESHRPTTSAPALLAVDFGDPWTEDHLIPIAMVAAACARAGNGVFANNLTHEEFDAAAAEQYARWLAEPDASPA